MYLSTYMNTKCEIVMTLQRNFALRRKVSQFHKLIQICHFKKFSARRRPGLSWPILNEILCFNGVDTNSLKKFFNYFYIKQNCAICFYKINDNFQNSQLKNSFPIWLIDKSCLSFLFSKSDISVCQIIV